MKDWLVANGISLLTLVTMAFFAGVSYGKIDYTASAVKDLQIQVDTHTMALVEITTELKFRREQREQKSR